MVGALEDAGITKEDRPQIDRWLAEEGLEPNKDNVLKVWADRKRVRLRSKDDKVGTQPGPHVELKITNENGTLQGTLHGKDAEALLRQAAPLLLGLKS